MGRFLCTCCANVRVLQNLSVSHEWIFVMRKEECEFFFYCYWVKICTKMILYNHVHAVKQIIICFLADCRNIQLNVNCWLSKDIIINIHIMYTVLVCWILFIPVRGLGGRNHFIGHINLLKRRALYNNTGKHWIFKVKN